MLVERGVRRLTSALVAAAVLVTGLAAVPAAPAEAATGNLTFSGHGWGHGRGMGQYGAYGYAVDKGWSHTQILAHYYGGTTLSGTAGNPTIDVELTRFTGKPTVLQGRALKVDGTAAVTGFGYLRLQRQSNGTFTVSTGSSCSGPWTTWRSGVASGVTVEPAGTSSADMIRTCESGTRYAYRGAIRVVGTGGTAYTFNRLTVDAYLRGVVPRESPASWGSAGGGRGMNALRAQAVAARSYALSGSRSSGATTCDTTACQVYLGAYSATADGAGAGLTSLEHPSTTDAVTATSGQVMRTSGGGVARTEFSSSTGGWTAGGTFPAVQDLGDATAANPNHSWTTSVSLSTAASRLGTGAIASIRVTGRNGKGADGGRVTQVTVVSTTGAVTTRTGNEVRTALGLKSDWFSISGYVPAEAEAVVRALYQDLLLRDVDASGLSTWTSRLLTGTSQAQLVSTLTSSTEYRRLRISDAYRQVLGREPDAGGMASWLSQIAAGRASVDDVAVRFYASQEYYDRAGRTDAGYVRRLFETALGRSAGSGELSHWVGQLDRLGRAGVVRGIWFSQEAARVRAGGYYEVFLDRAPDAGGVAGWADLLLRQGEGAVRVGIAGSQEYRNLAVKNYG